MEYGLWNHHHQSNCSAQMIRNVAIKFILSRPNRSSIYFKSILSTCECHLTFNRGADPQINFNIQVDLIPPIAFWEDDVCRGHPWPTDRRQLDRQTRQGQHRITSYSNNLNLGINFETYPSATSSSSSCSSDPIPVNPSGPGNYTRAAVVLWRTMELSSGELCVMGTF